MKMRKNRGRKVKTGILITAIICMAAFSGVPERYMAGEDALYTVEAKAKKKDKKKPVFKKFGKTKMKVEKGKKY